jgi:hypothetical protein
MQRRKRHIHSITSSAEQRLRDFEAERLRGLEIDHELEFGRLPANNGGGWIGWLFFSSLQAPAILRELPLPL